MGIVQAFSSVIGDADLVFRDDRDAKLSTVMAEQADQYRWDCVFPNLGGATKYQVDESLLVLNREAVLESLRMVGQRELVRLHATYPGVGAAVEALSLEQFSPQMYRANYINGEETTNFPLTAEKLELVSKEAS